MLARTLLLCSVSLVAWLFAASASATFFFDPSRLENSTEALLIDFENPGPPDDFLPNVQGVEFCNTFNGSPPSPAGADCITNAGSIEFFSFNEPGGGMLGARKMTNIQNDFVNPFFSNSAIEFLPPLNLPDLPNGDPQDPLQEVTAAGAWVAGLGSNPATFLTVSFYEVLRGPLGEFTDLLEQITVDLRDGMQFVGSDVTGSGKSIGRIEWEWATSDGEETAGPGFFGVDDIRYGTPVPEPGTSLLVGVGLAALAFARRKR